MSWYYTGNPTSSNKDAVRFWTGDTNSTLPLLQDEEIEYALTLQPNIRLCAADCLDAIATKLSQEVNFSSLDLRMDLGQRAANYRKRAIELRKEAQRIAATPYAGGISVADKDLREADADRVKPAFVVNGMNYLSTVEDEES